jgi:hypothetical protein
MSLTDELSCHPSNIPVRTKVDGTHTNSTRPNVHANPHKPTFSTKENVLICVSLLLCVFAPARVRESLSLWVCLFSVLYVCPVGICISVSRRLVICASVGSSVCLPSTKDNLIKCTTQSTEAQTEQTHPEQTREKHRLTSVVHLPSSPTLSPMWIHKYAPTGQKHFRPDAKILNAFTTIMRTEEFLMDIDLCVSVCPRTRALSECVWASA